MNSGSFEQLADEYRRKILDTRGKILDDFYAAYISHLSKDNPDLCIEDVCLVEHQCDGPCSLNRKYWFEYKPKFDK
jgi:hypothetical protein